MSEKNTIEDVKEARAGRTAEATEATEATKPTNGNVGEKPAKKVRRKRQTKKPEADILPLETFKEVSDAILDIPPATFENLTQAGEAQKMAVAKSGRAVVVKRMAGAENFNEIVLALVLVPLAIKWILEIFKGFFNESEKQTPPDIRPIRNGEKLPSQ